MMIILLEEKGYNGIERKNGCPIGPCFAMYKKAGHKLGNWQPSNSGQPLI